MRRLSPLHAEEEPIPTDSQQSGHTIEFTAAGSLATGASAGRRRTDSYSDANRPTSPGITQSLNRMDALLEEASTMCRRLL
jgi:hypothetical protein